MTLNIPQAKIAANYRKVKPAPSCSNCQFRNEDTDICQGNPHVAWFKIIKPMEQVCDHWALL